MKGSLKLHITMGLPGSGKSDWCVKSKLVHLDYDHYFKHFSAEDAKKRFVVSANHNLSYNIGEKGAVIDGIFLKFSSIADCLNAINKPIIDRVKKLTIHVWEEDREACLHNDKNRRPENSTVTIMNAFIEKKTESEAKDFFSKEGFLFDVEFVNHKVVRKPEWLTFVHDNSICCDEQTGILRSENWSTGGDWRDCWGGGGEIGEESPDEFAAFWKILEDLGFERDEDGNEIFNCVVNTEDDYESDYYGGCRNFSYYTCRIETLLDKVKEMEDSRGKRLGRKLGIV